MKWMKDVHSVDFPLLFTPIDQIDIVTADEVSRFIRIVVTRCRCAIGYEEKFPNQITNREEWEMSRDIYIELEHEIEH